MCVVDLPRTKRLTTNKSRGPKSRACLSVGDSKTDEANHAKKRPQSSARERKAVQGWDKQTEVLYHTQPLCSEKHGEVGGPN